MTSATTGKKYGVQKVCQVWNFPRSTFYDQKQRVEPTERQGSPKGCPDDLLVERIRLIIEESPFLDEGYRKVWARLRHAGFRTSKKRVRRLMREHNLQATQRPRRNGGERVHDGRITTDIPDEMWGMDATSTVTIEEGTATIFIAVDHCTQECVGIHASKSAKADQALEPLRQAMRHSFDAYEEKAGLGLSIRHDHGSQYISRTFQDELRFLGITSTPSFVAEPQCNGVSERFIKTLKEQLLHVFYFQTIEDLRKDLIHFKERYNAEWLVQKHNYQTPNQVRESFLTNKKVA